MMDKRLLALVPEAMRYVARAVVWKWVGLFASICLATGVAYLMNGVVTGVSPFTELSIALIVVALIGRVVSVRASERASFAASQDVKRKLRRAIFEKLLRLGPAYNSQVPTAEAVQLSVEGCEQLETYFGQYLPQLFYAVVAPLTLFVFLIPQDFRAAIALLVCVPLIPIAIVLVQKLAKRILSQYWGQYAQLGDSFLENLQGLTTLKIYDADQAKHEEMSAEAEHFRIVTMKVLSMQLNSIIVMDLVALGGAAVGISVALMGLAAGTTTLFQALLVILLSAEFFLPMRQLGSYFHVAMNGIAASGKIFELLALPEPEKKVGVPTPASVPEFEKVCFAYGDGDDVLHEVSLKVEPVGITAVVGVSGSGKSTLAGLLAGRLTGYSGHIRYGSLELSDANPAAMAQHVTTVGLGCPLFAGTVRDNLLLAAPDAEDERLWKALEAASIADWLRDQDGLDTVLAHDAANISGGQRQRLAFARAWLHNSPVFVFDEATSSIDTKSESTMLASIEDLAQDHAVLMISHRLANVVGAQMIHVMDRGRVVESGTHEELLAKRGVYARMWERQQELEAYGRGGSDETRN